MPEMDGVEATVNIRAWEKENGIQNRVPIVAMTANTLKSDLDMFIEVGMDDYLGKPFNTTDLRQVIERVNRLIEQKTLI